MVAKTDYLVLNEHTKLLKRLSAIITLKHRELLWNTNYNLLVLFWQVGNTVKKYLNSDVLNESEYPKPNYLILALEAEFGPFFSLQNIMQMVEFSTVLPDILSIHKFAKISWGHIQILLPEKNLEKWEFYLEITCEEGLTPSELTEKISSHLFENRQKTNQRDSKGKKRDRRKIPPFYLGLFDYRYHSLLPNFFVEPLLHGFKKMIEPKDNIIPLNDNTQIKMGLLCDVNQLVLMAQNQHARQLNSRFNMFLYETAEALNNGLTAIPITKRDSFFKKISNKLSDTFSGFFNKNLFSQILTCTNEISESLIFIRIAHLITWEHLLVLLPFKNIETILFYARFAADKGLSVAELSDAINSNTYEKMDGAKEIEQNQIRVIKSHASITTVKIQGNNIDKGTELIIDFGEDINDSKAVLNIFENHYFMNFITIPYFRQELK